MSVYRTTATGSAAIAASMAAPSGQARRQAVGTKAWARCWCVGNNAKTLTIMFGVHEYEG